MSAKWKGAFVSSLVLHLILLIGLGVWSTSWSPKPPRIVRVNLRAINTGQSLPPKSKGAESPKTKLLHQASKPKTSEKKPRVLEKPRKKRLLAKKMKRSSRAPKSVPRVNEERLLRQKLARLAAEAEERKLKEILAALAEKKRQLQKAPFPDEGVSLKGAGVSQDLGTKISARLKAFWEVPLVLKGRKDLWAEVSLEIAPNGHIIHWRFLRRSGEPLFDEAISRTLKLADPLPAPGRGLSIPVVFKIQ